MSVALRERPADVTPAGGNGGRPARRAVARWAWRLFRREWRQQLLVLVLLSVAVAATARGVSVATNTIATPHTTFTLAGTDPNLAADVAAFQKAFPDAEVIAHQKLAVPGSIATVDLRAEDPTDSHGKPRLRLLAGRYPTGAGEVSVTHEVAVTFSLAIGGTWDEGGRTWRVVGLVENPHNLRDAFALVAPGQADPPDTVTIGLDTDSRTFGSFRLASGTPLTIEAESAAARDLAAAAVLALATLGLLFVGLVAVAGFTVMAQRHLRALGMLGSLGATDRHVRLVMLANGAVVGAVAAVAGTAVGLSGWLAFAPSLETIAARRINRFDLPWWAIGASMVLAVVTAVAAAWWPARTASRIPVVAALSGRPPRPQPAHRFAALGGILLAAGVGLLAFSHQRRPLFIVIGVVATTLGILFVAPLSIRALAAAGRRAPIAVRLAIRDLARYQARSGAALGAITLAVGIAAAVAVSATASVAATDDTTGGNLPDNEIVIHLNDLGPVPIQTPEQLQTLQTGIDDLAASIGARDVVSLDAAVDPNGPGIPAVGDHQGGKEGAALVNVTPLPDGTREELIAMVFVATPQVLAHYGIDPTGIDPTADIVTSRTDLGGLELGYGRGVHLKPKIQTVALPTYSSDPNTLITTRAVQKFGLQAVPSAWLIRTPQPLTAAQINSARQMAAAAGVRIETRQSHASLSQLRDDATAVGILMALGVLAMTVGLIRSETANDLRTLTAAGASSATRRTLTSATAGSLALLGALLGTAGAYLALIAWHRSDLHPLTHVPVIDLVAIVIGLPLVAIVGGWLLAGREPSTIARQPLE